MCCLHERLALTRCVHAPTIQTMYILTRYVVWDVLKYFLAALLVLTLIFTFGMGFKRGIIDEGFPPLVMLQSIPFILPEMLGITIPVAMLLAVSSVFGRMTGFNEMVALKSLGISPMALVWPVLALAAFTSLGTILMYEVSARWCRPGFLRLASNSIEEIAYSRLQKKSSYDHELFSVTVKGVEIREGHRILVKPTITLKAQPGKPKITLTAAEAEFHMNHEAKTFDIVCRNGEIDVEGRVRMSFPDEQPYSLPMHPPAWDPRHRDWVASGSIPGLIAGLQAEIKGLRKTQQSLDEIRKANESLGITMPSAEADNIAREITDRQHKVYRLRTETYRRWSNGFTCLCFALVGMPVAMLWRHADWLTNFFVCFLPILSIYYPLLMLGEELSTSGAMPPITFWMGNVVLTIPAVILLRWIIQH